MGEHLNRSVPGRGLCHRFDIRPLPADAPISFPAGSTLFSHSFNRLDLVRKLGFRSKKYSSCRLSCRTIPLRLFEDLMFVPNFFTDVSSFTKT